jgi:hypothetical protein
MTERFICDLLASFNIWQMPTCLVHFCTKWEWKIYHSITS